MPRYLMRKRVELCVQRLPQFDLVKLFFIPIVYILHKQLLRGRQEGRRKDEGRKRVKALHTCTCGVYT